MWRILPKGFRFYCCDGQIVLWPQALSLLVFGATEQLSLTLQYIDINARDVFVAVSGAVSFFKNSNLNENVF